MSVLKDSKHLGNLKVLLTGGGTGGHIYPALAFADRLKEIYPHTEFLYIGTDRGLESQVVPEHGIPFKSINIEGFSRRLNFKGIQYNLNSVKLFLSSLMESKNIIKNFKPDVVIGTGGYVCAPVCYISSKKKIPTIIHEQNSVAGITNKFLARYVDKIAICFEEARKQFGKNEEKVIFTGNPRAQEVAGIQGNNELSKLGLDESIPSLIIFGGSRGAKKINDTFIQAYGELAKKEYQVLFVTGNDHYDALNEELTNLYGLRLNPKNIFVKPYIKNMPNVFADIDLVVARSGATTLAEITALGIPSVLIPSPNVTEDHQTKNAMSLVSNEAAELIKEEELNVESLIDHLDKLMNHREKRLSMAMQSKKIGRPNAADDLIQVTLDIIKDKTL